MMVHVRPSGDKRIKGGRETRHGSSRWGEDEVGTREEIVPERFQKVRVSWAQVSWKGMECGDWWLPTKPCFLPSMERIFWKTFPS
jgi:hypothetical protein